MNEEARKSLVTIVPPHPEGGVGLRKCQGTKVILEDGTELRGVVKVVLTAEVDSVWTAEITLHPNMEEMSGMLGTITRKPDPWWRRLWAKLTASEIDVTCLDSSARSYREP